MNYLVNRIGIACLGLSLAPALWGAAPAPATDEATTLAGAPPAVPTDASTEFALGGESAWRFVPQATALLTYDDNIFISSGGAASKVSDTYFQFAPGLAFGLGDFRGQVAPYAAIPHLLAQTGEEDLPRTNFLYAIYTPDFEIFAKNHQENTVNEDVRLAGQEQTDLWRIYGTLHYQLVTEPSIYLGSRARQTYYTAYFDGSYQVTGKIAGGVQVAADRDEVTGGFTQQQAKATFYADYTQSDKTTFGLGLAAGDLHQTDDPAQPYFQVLGRFRYRFTEKISVNGDAGPEFRWLGEGAGERSGAVFDVNADYASTESTTFSLSARRATVGAVEYRGVDIWESVYQAAVRQRVGPGFAVTLTGGLVWDQYDPYGRGVVLTRRDEYLFYRAAVGHDLTKHGTAQITFEHRDNRSTQSSYRFTENLLTLNVSFLF